MEPMRFFMLARRVIQIERAEKAMPPRRSLRPVFSLGLGGCESCCCGWDGGSEGGCALAEDWNFWLTGRSVMVFSCWVVVVESGLELEPQPKYESILFAEWRLVDDTGEWINVRELDT